MDDKTLPEFIEMVGDQAAADLFGVKKRTAQSWRLRSRFPRPEQSNRIVEKTAWHECGPVTHKGIYSMKDSAA